MKKMQLRKGWIILLALLLAAMVIVPYGSAGTISAVANFTSIPDKNDGQDDGTRPKLPDFLPSISDKLSYDEEQRLIKNYTPTPPVPESEMARIIFSKKWFLQNDKDPQSDMVQLTFPVTWLDKTAVSDNEAVVMLHVPKRLLELQNTNPDPQMMTVSFSENWFKEFPNMSSINFTSHSRKNDQETDLQYSRGQSVPTLQKNQKLSEKLGINRQVRGIYHCFENNPVTADIGLMNAFSYSNSGETFRNYDEREIYLDRSGDIVEFITDFTDSGQTYAWVAVYDEGTWVTAWNWLNIDISGTLQETEYRLYINNGVYDLWLCDADSEICYHNSYNDTDNPSTGIQWLMGSTELDTVGGISNYFKTCTSPIDDAQIRIGTTYYYPSAAFEWWDITPDEQYVSIDSDFVYPPGRIRTIHYAGINY